MPPPPSELLFVFVILNFSFLGLHWKWCLFYMPTIHNVCLLPPISLYKQSYCSSGLSDSLSWEWRLCELLRNRTLCFLGCWLLLCKLHTDDASGLVFSQFAPCWFPLFESGGVLKICMHAYFDVHFFSLTTFSMHTRFSDTWVCGISHTLLPRECGD